MIGLFDQAEYTGERSSDRFHDAAWPPLVTKRHLCTKRDQPPAQFDRDVVDVGWCQTAFAENVSKTPVESRGLTGTGAATRSRQVDWDSNSYSQKSRAINHLERRVLRIRIPASPPTFARLTVSELRLASQRTH